MRKKQLCHTPEEFTPSASGGIIRKHYQFELITPMFGGDAESWKLDLKNPVRGQSVKGQLRFWWRTMQNINDHSLLLDTENSVWGGKTADYKNGSKSKVLLSISEVEIGDKVCAEMANKYAVKDDVMPTNVLFPITSLVKNLESIYFITKMKFTLNISFPESKKNEIINTLKLWTLLGGIGARTRRGTGSIYCKELLEGLESQKDILSFFKDAASGETDDLEYSRIAGVKFFSQTINSGDTAKIWHSFLESYGKFRQDRPQGKPPGRSYWPEPDAIRLITGQFPDVHTPVHPDGKWFPRAAFGLPILTKFTGDNEPGNGNNINLEPDIGTGERYPSPVILKVIRLNNGTILKCAIVLNQKFPQRLVLKVRHENYNITGKMLPFHSGYETTKDMRKGHPLNGNTIYENLANHLSLSEVK
ncbi:Putative CRISPR type III-B/RAMP module RAMP protein [Desulfonema limicola]|uniref:CRISPR type III-B/RAMP module RAMP protein n=1 Tax=Desulfonema limicola TaxID=45656 RepID=A0A975GGE9_9BACT|nr:type III-B CRISPR module RAMP protein Cmr1 [Desulfonema limicola]QTA80246.1 Putative CRISPR type III-B/RAMP module RAMP protein [Desulfonema limicola]